MNDDISTADGQILRIAKACGLTARPETKPSYDELRRAVERTDAFLGDALAIIRLMEPQMALGGFCRRAERQRAQVCALFARTPR
jgi:hypothetical protein